METKVLLTGIICFLLGGLLVSVVASTMPSSSTHDSMKASVGQLAQKQGDEFDKAFLVEMIMHHEGAVDMAQLAESRASHEEVKQLAESMIATQSQEVQKMKQWQKDWGYFQARQGH